MSRSRLAATLRAFVPIQRPALHKEYDYIVVGGGSGGGHLAYRLSEDPSCRVLLVEAGRQDNTPWVHVPVFYFKSIGTPSSDWMFKTHGPTSGLGGRSLAWPRGKVLGGSSSLNGLLYIRGLAHDYDSWAAAGNEGWAWSDVMPHFQGCEDAPFEGPERGHGGPMSVSEASNITDLAERWSSAASETCGVPRIRDMSCVAGHGQASRGAGVAYFSNIKSPDGFRCSTALPLHEVRGKRENLHILCNSEVEKVLMNGSRVEGISLGGQEAARVAPGGEVILAAGAIGSPHILLRSGIGASAALADAGVACQHELPGVGENLQDHLQLRPKFRVTSPTLNTQVGGLVKHAVKGGVNWLNAFASPTAWRFGAEFLFKRSGPVSMAASQVCAFVNSRPDLPAPDLQFHFQPLSTTGTPAVYLDSFDAFTASVCILRPESKGRLSLQSDGGVRISPNYLTTKADQDLAVRSLEIAREISQHPLLREIGAEEVDPPAKTDVEHARRVAETIYHPAGTCKMGPSSDAEAVVDPQLRVHGLDGLRVVDCSIMPNIVSGNTHAPTVMIAEKAASLLRSAA
jgi:choline dehydrogenase